MTQLNNNSNLQRAEQSLPSVNAPAPNPEPSIDTLSLPEIDKEALQEQQLTPQKKLNALVEANKSGDPIARLNALKQMSQADIEEISKDPSQNQIFEMALSDAMSSSISDVQIAVIDKASGNLSCDSFAFKNIFGTGMLSRHEDVRAFAENKLAALEHTPQLAEFKNHPLALKSFKYTGFSDDIGNAVERISTIELLGPNSDTYMGMLYDEMRTDDRAVQSAVIEKLPNTALSDNIYMQSMLRLGLISEDAGVRAAAIKKVWTSGLGKDPKFQALIKDVVKWEYKRETGSSEVLVAGACVIAQSGPEGELQATKILSAILNNPRASEKSRALCAKLLGGTESSEGQKALRSALSSGSDRIAREAAASLASCKKGSDMCQSLLDGLQLEYEEPQHKSDVLQELEARDIQKQRQLCAMALSGNGYSSGYAKQQVQAKLVKARDNTSDWEVASTCMRILQNS